MNSRIGSAVLLSLTLAAPVHALPLPRVHPGSPWYQRIDQASVHPNSAGPNGMIATLKGLGGFGFGRMQIDFGMHVLYAPAGTPTRNVIQIPSGNPDDAYYLPDCEPLATPVPLPIGGAIEGETGYTCDNLSNDCHLLVVQGNEIFELYRTNLTVQGMEAQCLVRWRMDVLYPATGRGEHCTSADAAGFPMAPLLFNAELITRPATRPSASPIPSLLPVISSATRAPSGFTSLPRSPDYTLHAEVSAG